MPIQSSRSALHVAAVSMAASCALFLVAAGTPLYAQSPAPAEPATAVALPLELGSLAWLEGCWHGTVAQYEINEHWLPFRGGLMLGAGHTLLQGKTSDYQYLRLETRPDGVYYVAITSDRKETPFRLTAAASEGKDTIFTFTNPVDAFPQRIVYRRGTDGWLYANVEGKVNGEEKKVIYPMRRVDCQSGEFIRK